MCNRFCKSQRFLLIVSAGFVDVVREFLRWELVGQRHPFL